jgi:cation:H+ antiporter
VTGLLLLAVSAALLIVGAELFVENAAGAATRLGVTVIAVGVLLAGAEPEELLTAVIAAGRGRPELAAGDAIGANVTMLTACLGLAAVVRPLHLSRRVRQYAGLSTVAGVIAMVALAGGHLGRIEGLVLVAGYVVLVGLVWWREREPPRLGELAELGGHEEGGQAGPARSPAVSLILVLAGLAVMLVGGDVAVEGAVRVVDALGRSDSAVGLTALALATTAELFALVLTAMRHEVPELAVAGVVGSAAYNATATLGAAALTRPLHVPAGLAWTAAVAAVLPLVVLALAWRGRLGRPAGALLLAGYAGYVVLVLR